MIKYRDKIIKVSKERSLVRKMKKVTIHLPRWEELPNIDLYLDQVVTLMEEYLGNVSKEEKIIRK